MSGTDRDKISESGQIGTRYKSGDRLEFANGWTIDIHEIRDGQYWFRRWPPGVTDQSFVCGLKRMPIAEFEEQAKGAQ